VKPESIISGNSLDKMANLVCEIVRNLDDITGLDRVWPRGVVHRGGPHYRLKGTVGPISLGVDECIVFGRLIERFKPANCFIIGNAFGMSSAFIAKMMEYHNGQAVITLDSKSEGNGSLCFETAARVCDRMKCRILKNKWGWSPKDVMNAAEDGSYDLIFIDGDHSHPQVTLDFNAVQPLVREETIICWHDYWLAGIPESVGAAAKAGYQCVKVNTSCEMVFGTRSTTKFRALKSMFPNSDNPVKRPRPMAYLRLYQAIMVGMLKAYLHRKSM